MMKGKSRVVGSFNKKNASAIKTNKLKAPSNELWPSLDAELSSKQPSVTHTPQTDNEKSSSVVSSDELQDTLFFLKSLFDTLDIKTIQAELVKNDYDVEKTVEKLLIILDELADGDIGNEYNTLNGKVQHLADSFHELDFAPTEDDNKLFDDFILSGSTPSHYLATYFENISLSVIQTSLEQSDFDLISAYHKLKAIPNVCSHPLDTELSKNINSLKILFPKSCEDNICQLLYLHNNDIEKVSNELLKSPPNAGPLDKLTEMFPDMPEDQLMQALQSSESVDDAIHKLLSVDTTTSSISKKSKQTTLLSFGSGFKSNPNPNISLDKSTLIRNTIAHTGIQVPKVHVPHDYYRIKAKDIHDSRVDLYKRAAQAWRKGDITGRGVAAYYSQEGHLLTNRMKEFNEQAAQAVIYENRQRFQNELNVLDLHGLTVNEAKEHSLTYITQYFAYGKKPPLKVITGSGQHSVGGVARLYPVIYAFLKKQGYRVEASESRGWFYVRC